MSHDWVHLAKLAKPKTIHPYFIPDRASVYWLDYLIDPRPHEMTDPDELREYYDQQAERFPSTNRLSTPRSSADLSCSSVTSKASDRTKTPSHLHLSSSSLLSSSTDVSNSTTGSFLSERQWWKSDQSKGDHRSPSPHHRSTIVMSSRRRGPTSKLGRRPESARSPAEALRQPVHVRKFFVGPLPRAGFQGQGEGGNQ